MIERQKGKRFPVAGLLLAGMLLLAACGDATATAGPSADAISTDVAGTLGARSTQTTTVAPTTADATTAPATTAAPTTAAATTATTTTVPATTTAPNVLPTITPAVPTTAPAKATVAAPATFAPNTIAPPATTAAPATTSADIATPPDAVTNATPTPASAPLAAAGKILFNTGDINKFAVINPDGSGQKRVALGSESYGDLAWSPDGTRVAYFAIDRSSGQEKGVIRTAKLDGSDPQNVCPIDATQVGGKIRWSPDGRTIGYLAAQDGPHGPRLCDVATGRVTPELRLNGAYSSVAFVYDWSPDSPNVLMEARPAGDGYHLYYGDPTNLADGNLSAAKQVCPDTIRRQFTFQGGDTSLFFPDARISNTGRTIACVGTNITLVAAPGHTSDLDGKVLDVGNADDVRWSPDGTKLAFDTFDSTANKTTISIVEIATGKITQLADNASLYDWSRQ